MIELEHAAQRPTLDTDGRRRVVRYGDYTVFSAFMPIMSVAHRRAVGYQALLHAHDAHGGALAPHIVFNHAARLGDLLELGRLMQSLHLANFCALAGSEEWLFLHLHPMAMTDTSYGEALLAELKGLGLRPQRLVLEVPDDPHGDPQRFFEVVEFLRRHGFLIALDDFGARHSNIDRVWQVQPDIVKLDQKMIAQAANHHHVERVLPGLVSLLHETGRLVLAGAVATQREALIAMECNVDFVQGGYFAPAAVDAVDSGGAALVIDGLMDALRRRVAEREAAHATRLAPYERAMHSAVGQLEAGATADVASAALLSLPDAARCFVLDEHGRQRGDNLVSPRRGSRRSNRFLPLLHSEGARWERRPYFINALKHPGEVHVTRPYLSINEAHLCVTLSMATRIGSETLVFCADIDWERQRP